MIPRRRTLLQTGILLAAGLALSVAGRPAARGAHPAGPVLSENGLIRTVRRSAAGIWNLITLRPETPDRVGAVPLPIDGSIREPAVFSDAPGFPLWLAAEVQTPGGGTVRVGPLGRDGFEKSVTVGLLPGWNGLADLDFLHPGEPWVAWLRKAGPVSDVWVQDIAGNRRWKVTPDGTDALSAPKILADSRGGIWILWTGRERGEYVLAARRFDGRSFSPVVRIASNGERPVLQPDAVRGRDGILRAAWSAYDGRDYEIFAADCPDGTWSAPRPLSDHPAADDWPRLLDLGRAGTAVAWVRSGIGATRVCVSFLVPGRKAAPVFLPAGFASPDIAAFGTDFGPVFLEGESAERGKLVPLAALLAAQPDRAPARPASPVGPARDEDVFLCFGDSITYGEWGDDADPTVGYPPRLDGALDAAFGPTDVVNEGYSGEYTAGGLARIDSVLAASAGRWVLVMEGTNDVKKMSIPIETAVFNLKEICSRCLAKGAYPFLATVIPRRDWVWFAIPEIRIRHQSLETGVRQAAAALKIPLVDMESAFNAYPGGLASLLQEDGKHPSLAGYQLLADTWETSIRAFPFPPEGLVLREKLLEVPGYSPRGRLHDAEEYATLPASRLGGIVLFWVPNPKADPARIGKYRIYRKDGDAGSFTLRGFVTALCAFFDRDVAESGRYDYVVAAVGTSGFEGPRSGVVSND